MSKRGDSSLVLLEAISASLRIIERIGDAISLDTNMSPDTKKRVDTLIISLNSVFTEAIKLVEDAD